MTEKVHPLQSIMRIILRILHYFREHPLHGKGQGPVKRFPKFLTKYSLFKDQVR